MGSSLKMVAGGGGLRRFAAFALVAFALGAVACKDSTGPEEPPITLEPPLPGSPLAVAAGLLEDATAMFLPSITNTTTRTSLQSLIRSLATNILAGDYTKARADLASGRGVLSGLNAVENVETAPIGVAFDFVDQIMTAAGK